MRKGKIRVRMLVAGVYSGGIGWVSCKGRWVKRWDVGLGVVVVDWKGLFDEYVQAGREEEELERNGEGRGRMKGFFADMVVACSQLVVMLVLSCVCG